MMKGESSPDEMGFLGMMHVLARVGAAEDKMKKDKRVDKCIS